MKSCVTHVLGLYSAIIADVAIKIPSIHRSLERDKTRFHSAFQGRGLGFFTLDLPEYGKHFDKCLASGRLTKVSLPYSGSKRRGEVVPKLFGGLLSRVFDSDGLLLADPDVVAIQCLRQLYFAAKKTRIDTNELRRFNTVRNFFRIDTGLRRPTLPWSDDAFEGAAAKDLDLRDSFGLLPHPLPLFDDLCDRMDSSRGPAFQVPGDMVSKTQQVYDLISSWLGEFNPSEWKQKHGPGAVSDRTGTRYSKYSFPNWPDKLESIFPASEFAYANFLDWAEDAQGGSQCGLKPHEPPAKLITVPKTLKAPRLIASEPTSHQWAQQSIFAFLVQTLEGRSPLFHGVRVSPISCPSSMEPSPRDSLMKSSRRTWRNLLSSTINLGCGQDLARDAALKASHTQTHATVDLSDASDRLSCWLVERMFRRNTSLLNALQASRTRWVVNTIDCKSPQYYVLRKFACMGSACTFPVQSIAYAGMAIAALLTTDRLPVTFRNVAAAAREVLVFGDDTIIPERGLDLFLGILSYLEFKVNHSKTFGTGKFRESCGMDAWDGNDVTPCYSMEPPVRTRPESIASVVETSNNFQRKCWPSTAEWLKSTVEAEVGRNRIPYLAMDSGSFGWKRPWKMSNSHLRTRWNRHLHRSELLCLTVNGKVTKFPDHSPRSLLQYFTEAPEPTAMWVSGVSSRPKVNLRLRWEAIED